MSVPLTLEGRRILITGAAGGLGRAIVRRLSECGTSVAVTDVDGDGLAEVAGQALAAGAPEAATLEVDLASINEAKAVPDRAATALSGLDGLVNCAGIQRTTPFSDVTADEWQRIISVNLTATFLVTQAAANLMRNTGGSVVTLASVAARSGRADAAHYSATKTALLSLTKSAALAYAPAIRVNAVCPGVFLTPMWDDIMHERDEQFGAGEGRRHLNDMHSRTPLGRSGNPTELANVVAFLLSELASFITGQAINVDGGLEMD